MSLFESPSRIDLRLSPAKICTPRLFSKRLAMRLTLATDMSGASSAFGIEPWRCSVTMTSICLSVVRLRTMLIVSLSIISAISPKPFLHMVSNDVLRRLGTTKHKYAGHGPGQKLMNEPMSAKHQSGT